MCTRVTNKKIKLKKKKEKNGKMGLTHNYIQDDPQRTQNTNKIYSGIDWFSYIEIYFNFTCH